MPDSREPLGDANSPGHAVSGLPNGTGSIRFDDRLPRPIAGFHPAVADVARTLHVRAGPAAALPRHRQRRNKELTPSLRKLGRYLRADGLLVGQAMNS